MKVLRVLPIILITSCTNVLDRVEEVGGVAFDKMEQSSTLGVRGSVRYLCEIARVGPLLEFYDTDELRDSWSKQCKKNLTLPAVGL